MLSICGNIFCSQQDYYLKRYFENAVFLYESNKYKEAALLFEKIIEVEKAEGRFYFTPFAEIYIKKAKDKDVTLMDLVKKSEQPDSQPIATVQDTENSAITEKGQEAPEKNYDNIIDYYESKHKTLAETPSSSSARQGLLSEKLDQGIENLDDETLKSLYDERFVDIVKRIKQYKKSKRSK